MFDYFEKLKEKTEKYSDRYASNPCKAALRLSWWNFVSIFRMLQEKSGGGDSSRDKKLQIAFALGGGIGDVVMSALYVDRFVKKLDCCHGITLFVKQSVSSIRSLLEAMPFAQDICSFNKLIVHKFDLVILLDVQYPVVQYANMEKIVSLSPFLASYVERLKKFRTRWGNVASKGNETFRQQYKCLIDGTTRITAMDIGGVLGIRHDDTLELKVPSGGEGALEKFGLSGRPFVLIQRGVDAKHSSGESIRLWSVKNYEELIRRFKERWPEIFLVQVGVSRERCRTLSGIDLDLVGKTSFAELMELAKEASLHIDSECGIVHLRHFLSRKPSLVLFGPTSPKNKGYSENINIRSDVCPCELCEWIIGGWQSVCVRNNTAVADCMEAITPELVMSRIEAEALRIFGA